jgi:hypothetical protein
MSRSTLNHIALAMMGLFIAGSSPASASTIYGIPMGTDATPYDNNDPADGLGNAVADQGITTGDAVGGTVKRIVVGTFSSATAPRCAVFVFQLPALPAGEQVQKASFAAYLNNSTGTPTWNVDLWAVRIHASSATVLAADYAAGDSLIAGQTGFKLVDNWVGTGTQSNGWKTYSDPETGGTLAGLLQTYYKSTPGGGGYLFLRAQMDTLSAGGAGLLRYFNSADWDGKGTYTRQYPTTLPELTITTAVPIQPGTVITVR